MGSVVIAARRSPSVPLTVIIGGLPTAVLTGAQLAQIMVRDCLSARAQGDGWRARLVFSSNGQAIAMAGKDPVFASAMAEADVIHADGMSIVFASRLLAAEVLPERVATTDFILEACRAAQCNGLKFYFLGGRESENARAVQWMELHFPGLEIAGRHHGYYAPEDEDGVICQIGAARPDVVWVGLGRPRQELFSIKLRSQLPSVGWIKTCGGVLDFYSGCRRRAPVWLQRCGLEWFYRAMQEPRRLGLRYLTTNLSATWLLLTRTHG